MDSGLPKDRWGQFLQEVGFVAVVGVKESGYFGK